MKRRVESRFDDGMIDTIDRIAEEEESSRSEVIRNLTRIGLEFTIGDEEKLISRLHNQREKLRERLEKTDKMLESLKGDLGE